MAQHEFKDTKNGLRENANKKIIAKKTQRNDRANEQANVRRSVC